MSGRTQEGSLYDVLEVGVTATREEIEASYHRIVSYLGPDALAVYSLMTEEEALRRRQELDDAYRTLTDSELRAAYDRTRENCGYPQVLVPANASDTTVSVGIVRTDNDVPLPDVDEIFRSGDHSFEANPATSRFSTTTLARDDREQSDAYNQGGASDDVLPLASMRTPRSEVSASGSCRGAEQPAEHASSQHLSRTASEPRPRDPRFSIALGRRYEPLPATAKTAKPVSRRLYPSVSIEITPDTEFSGALLRRLRESCQGTIEDIAAITKIRRVYLEAVEEHAFDVLPASVYVRGFVSEYARVLGLDPQLVAQSYMALYRRYRGETV